MITEVIASLEELRQALRRGRAINVNDQSTKDQAISLAQTYFNSTRPVLVQCLGEDKSILDHDRLWQRLVRLAHGSNSRHTYLKTVDVLKKQLCNFSVRALTSGIVNAQEIQAQAQLSREETLLIDTLERLRPSAAASYRQGLNDLKQLGRLSYRGTAAEFREALRETLDHLAPDEQVTKQEGFKLEPDQKKPTTKQKVRYVLTSRARNKTQRGTAEKSVVLIEEMAGDVTRAVYDHASLATHVQQSRREVEQIKRYVDVVLFDLLEISLEKTVGP